MTETTVFFEQHKMEWEVIEDKIKRQVVGYDNTIMMVSVKFEKGAKGELHYHFHTQESYITERKFQVAIGHEKKMLQKADSFMVPSNISHGVVCLEEGMLIVVFTPVRKDVLEQKNKS